VVYTQSRPKAQAGEVEKVQPRDGATEFIPEIAKLSD
jgi:hypothetical protein